MKSGRKSLRTFAFCIFYIPGYICDPLGEFKPITDTCGARHGLREATAKIDALSR